MLKARARTNEVETSFTNDAAIMTLDSENSAFASLSASLAEIRKLKGVLGYILRSNTSAIIDLNETDKLIENAVLSSQMHDSSIEIAEHFNMGDVESVLVEGKTIKVLCMNIDENKISIFMEKSATHAGIIKRILL